MELAEGIAFGGFVVATLSMFWRIVGQEGEKRKRIYGRMDEIKKNIDSKVENVEGKLVKELQSKEICNILHKEIKEDMQEIKKKVDCVPQIKAGMDLLLKKNGLKGE